MQAGNIRFTAVQVDNRLIKLRPDFEFSALVVYLFNYSFSSQLRFRAWQVTPALQQELNVNGKQWHLPFDKDDLNKITRHRDI